MKKLPSQVDFIVVGAGVAGLRAAIALAAAGKVLVLTKQELTESATQYAQGGIAVALSDEDEIGSKIEIFGRGHPKGGLIVAPDPFTTTHRVKIANTVARHAVPTVYPYRWFALAGGLVSYGTDVLDQFRRAGGYVDRILKGANPRDLPVQAPTKFEFVVNLKSARALGVALPPAFLSRADEIIE